MSLRIDMKLERARTRALYNQASIGDGSIPISSPRLPISPCPHPLTDLASTLSTLEAYLPHHKAYRSDDEVIPPQALMNIELFIPP